MYTVNVSSIQDFYQCRFRWWCKWIMNRVPLVEGHALDAGRLLHVIFEDAALGIDISRAAEARCMEWKKKLDLAHPLARPSGEKAIQVIEDLREAFPLWQDTFPVTRILEVEQPFEWVSKRAPDILWRGRPDTGLVSTNHVYHRQNRGLAASMNFGTYMVLSKRHYHEHLYGEYFEEKYCTPKSKLKLGGVIFNLVRKLKFRTNVGKKNEATKTAAEMFYQQAVSINTKSPLHNSVMNSMIQHVREMQRVEDEWRKDEIIPAPNEKMNGGFSGNAMDPYFRVLIGEISLDDNEVFKDREDTYNPISAEA